MAQFSHHFRPGDINVNTEDGIPTIWTDEGPIPCDGRLLDRRQYPETYKRIGHAYTDEDERCTTCNLFRIPDYRDLKDKL